MSEKGQIPAEAVKGFQRDLQAVRTEVGRVIVGHRDVVEIGRAHV